MSVYSCSWQLQRRKKKTHTSGSILPTIPGQDPGIWTFEDLIIQIRGPLGQNVVQMPYSTGAFVCQMPLLI